MKRKTFKFLISLLILVVFGFSVFATNINYGRPDYINYVEDLLLFLTGLGYFVKKIRTEFYLILSVILFVTSAVLEIFSLQVFSEVLSELAFFSLVIILIRRSRQILKRGR